VYLDETIPGVVGADLSGATLSSANLSQEELDKACGIDVKLDSDPTLKPCR
jgi:uncharacterized protein YjbI with pentapeptide repeats